MGRRFSIDLAGFTAINLLGFAVYRLVFLARFDGATDAAAGILIAGARIDLALLGLEASGLAAWALLRGGLVARSTRLLLAGLTWLHAFACFANHQFFAERNQHLWEMLIANVTRPDQLWWGVAPFVETRGPLLLGAIVGSLGFGAAAFAWARRAPREPWTWRGQRRRAAILAVGLLALTNLDLLRVKDGRFDFGWLPLPTASQRYMHFDAYARNQAVVNPLHDLVRYYLPANLVGLVRFGSLGVDAGELEPGFALERALEALALEPADPAFPLLRTVSSNLELGLRNVVLIEVEGLGSSVAAHAVEGRPVMPFLRRWMDEALYFPNFFQSSNSTDGSVFATTTSLPKTFSRLRTAFFLPYEVNGWYGSLPRILAGSHRHLFFQGFRQRSDDFIGFMGNQGHETWGYAALRERLARRGAAGPLGNSLGLFDHHFLDEAAAILAKIAGPFTAHLVTATSHSPWVVPEGSPRPFGEAELDTFHYVDASLATFVERLSERPDFDATLFVIVGDHTSKTFGPWRLERLRVPLILAGPAIERSRSRHAARLQTPGSHVDVLPTILHLLGGTHRYAGMGRSLLAPARERGIVSGTRYRQYYLRDGFVLRHDPFAPLEHRVELRPAHGDWVGPEDVSAEHPEVRERLRTEFLAQYETARRLVREKRIFPADH